MKRPIDDLKKETNDILLFDTNVLIDIEDGKCLDIDLKAIFNYLDSDIKPFVTDLSFCEMIIGCRNINDYLKHIRFIKEIECLVCGNSEELSNLLYSFNYDSIIDDSSLIDFKAKLLSGRNKTIFPIFMGLLQVYMRMCIILFMEFDENYYKLSMYIFEELFLKNNTDLYSIVYDFFYEFVDDKKESRKLIRDLFNELLVSLLICFQMNNKSRQDEYDKLKKILTPDNFTIIRKKLKMKNNPNDDKWLSKEYVLKMNALRDVVSVIEDGINFLNSRMIYNKANFNAHDLIDLYNFDFVFSLDINVHYFTNDIKRKWEMFVDVERKIRPNNRVFVNE